MTEQRQKLIDRFQRWLDTNPRKQIIAAECANIAEEYAKEQLRIADVVGQSEQLVCDCGSTDIKGTDYGFFKCNDCKNEWDLVN